MLADELDYVVGVDSHRDVHAVAVVQVVSGGVVFEASVAASSERYAQLVSFADMHAPGRRAFAVEGTGSFGGPASPSVHLGLLGCAAGDCQPARQALRRGRARKRRRSAAAKATELLEAVHRFAKTQ